MEWTGAAVFTHGIPRQDGPPAEKNPMYKLSLIACGFLLVGLAVGCRAPQRACNDCPKPGDVAPEPPVRQAESNGLLLNNGAMLLGPGAGGRSGYRFYGDGEWGF